MFSSEADVKLIDYTFTQTTAKDDLSFSPIIFENVNLLVGTSGSGKSRLLNTIFNLACFAFRENESLSNGLWDVVFCETGMKFHWKIEIDNKKVKSEYLWIISEDQEEDLLVERIGEEKFLYKGKELPKLTREKVSLVLLSEEKDISIARNGFGKFYRKRFSEDDLTKTNNLGAFTEEMLAKSFNPGDLDNYYNHPLNLKLYIIEKYKPLVFGKLLEFYRNIFPFVADIEVVTKSSIVPLVFIREAGGANYSFDEASSGMKKVLLLLLDILTMKPESVYLIDEYENSLGVNAIDFLPEFIGEYGKNMQFILTSHHPYVINSINLENWYVFGRNANKVKIMHGDDVTKRYGKSKQDAFIQLINDDFFMMGNE